MSTVAAPSARVLCGRKVFYEVTFEGKAAEKGGSVSYVGWAAPGFERCGVPRVNRCVGWCRFGWGYEGQHGMKYHNNHNVTWGHRFSPDHGRVLGVAADMVEGRLLYGMDGDWGDPMGVAFEDIDTEAAIFPAISAHNMQVVVNFGEADFKFGPPDETFEKLTHYTTQ